MRLTLIRVLEKKGMWARGFYSLELREALIKFLWVEFHK